MKNIDCERLEDRHDEIREQLEIMERWLENLPVTDTADRRRSMAHIVDFLQRYVFIDCAFEEEHLFPHLGDAALALRSEHGFFRRWVADLDTIARDDATEGAARFRQLATKLFGLLEAHLHTEDTIVGPLLDARRRPRAMEVA